jgi:hypothetical protein
VTLIPEYAATISGFSQLPGIRQTLTQDETYCTADDHPLFLPFTGTVVDANQDPNGSLPKFAIGPTTSFLLIMKPARGFRPELPVSYVLY